MRRAANLTTGPPGLLVARQAVRLVAGAPTRMELRRVWRLLVHGLGQSAQRAHTASVHPELGSFLHGLWSV